MTNTKPQHPKGQFGANGRFDVVGKDVGIRQIRIYILVKGNGIKADCKSDRTKT